MFLGLQIFIERSGRINKSGHCCPSICFHVMNQSIVAHNRYTLLIVTLGVAPATFFALFLTMFYAPTALISAAHGNVIMVFYLIWIMLAGAGTAGLWWAASSSLPLNGARNTALAGLLLCGMVAVGFGLRWTLGFSGGELLVVLLLAGPASVGLWTLSIISGVRLAILGVALAIASSVASFGLGNI